MPFTTRTKHICLHLIALILIAAAGSSCKTIRRASTGKTSADSRLANNLIDYSKKFLGTPYRYAGKGPYSFDCSGFTSYVFKEFGYKLNASSAAQGEQFVLRNREELQKGFGVFEGRSQWAVGHVGIVTEVEQTGGLGLSMHPQAGG